MPSLQHDVIALQTAGEVVPRGGDHGILALQVFDDLVCGSLEKGGKVSFHANGDLLMTSNKRAYLVCGKCAAILCQFEPSLKVIFLLLRFLQLLLQNPVNT